MRFEELKEFEALYKEMMEGKFGSCNCSLAVQLAGDGCRFCNPELYKELLNEEE